MQEGEYACRNMRAPGVGGWCGQEPHPGLRIWWAGTSLVLCSCMKHSPPRSWLRHDSAFIQEKLPAGLIAATFALFLQQFFLRGSAEAGEGSPWEMPTTSCLKKEVGRLWDSGGGMNSHKNILQQAKTLTVHIFHIKNLYESVILKMFPSFPVSFNLFGKRHMELIMNKGQLF